MHIKDSFSRKVFTACNTAFLVLLMIVSIYPLIYVIFASISDSNALMNHAGILLAPAGLSSAAYEAVMKNPNIMQGYKNTLIILIAGVSINMFFTALAAYVTSRKNVMLNKFFTFIMMFTMYFSGGLIPTYLLINNLGLTNTYWALILPSAISVYNMIIMRTGFSSIPDSLEESAKIDGANHFVILFKIVLPLSMPTIAVIILYYAVGTWNSWFPAMIYLQKRRDLQPLQLILRGILMENDISSMQGGNMSIDSESTAETIKYAVIVISTVPILMIYPFLQKYFIKGIMIGAVKG